MNHIKFFEPREFRFPWRVEQESYAAKILKSWSGFKARAYKVLKSLSKENLRDHMPTIKLVLNMLAKLSVTDALKKMASSKKCAGGVLEISEKELKLTWIKPSPTVKAQKNTRVYGAAMSPATLTNHLP